MDKGTPSCPDPEALAAWLDQGVSDTEREQIEAHLAACDDCRVLVACVIESQTAVLDPGVVAAQAPVPVLADARARTGGHPADAAARRGLAAVPRKNVVWGAASVVAAAAALVVSFQVAPSWWASWRANGVEQRLADLADAVGNERTVEARLTGGFRYSPLRAPVRSGGSSAATTDNWTLFAAAGRIREDADRDPSAANLHALGLAHLVLGEHDGAVRALEDAVAEAPDVPQYQSDLAGAYLARARALDRPDDLPRALGAAERAVKGNDALIEARFNRALALEALFLEEQARQAWQEYVSRDSGSGWADEARRHLAKLQGSAEQRGPQPDLARNNSPPPISDTSVEAGLDWLLRQGLPAWADAILANDSDRAAREHSSLTAYAEQISKISGDGFARSLVELTSVDDAADVKTRRATTIRAFAAVLTQVDAENLAAAEAALPPACVAADQALHVLCDYQRGGIDVVRRRDTDADRRVKSVLDAAVKNQWQYPRSLAKRLDGYRLLFQGRYAEASVAYDDAFNGFHRAKYLGSAGNLAGQLADLSDYAGRQNDGWRWRHASLDLAAATNSAGLRFLTRLPTADVLTHRDEREAAAVFINGLADADVSALPPIKRTILEIQRARIALANGDLVTARSSLRAASEDVAGASDFRVQRLAPDVLSLRAQIEKRENQLHSAKASLSAAIAAMGPERSAHRAGALIARAEVLSRVSAWQDAERDVNDAVALLKNRVGRPGSQPLRLDDAAAAFRAAAALAIADANFRGIRGLYLAEQLRETLDGTPGNLSFDTETHLAEAIKSQNPTAAILFYLFSEQSLLCWTIQNGGVHFSERPVDARSIRQLVSVLSVQVNRSPEREDLWRPTLGALHTALLAGLPIEAVTELTVVPDGILRRVPFGSLYDPNAGRFAFERTNVRVTPNLAFALDRSAATANGPLTIAAVGEPLLTGAGAEAFPRLSRARVETETVAGLYKNARAVVGNEATKARVLDALLKADVFHYAGHALASPDLQGPRLLLAGDVRDSASTLAAADLIGRLAKRPRVVLAACETALSPTSDRAAGLASLSAAFLRAGAGSVVASLWQVDDAASERFFVSVHRGLIAGNSTAAAVARAQRECRADAECKTAVATWLGTTVYGSQ